MARIRESAREQRTSTMQPRPDRTDGAAKRRGSLEIREAMQVAENDRLAVTVRQLPERQTHGTRLTSPRDSCERVGVDRQLASRGCVISRQRERDGPCVNASGQVTRDP